MAGNDSAWQLNDAKSVKEACSLVGKSNAPGVSYARLFSECDGRGEKEEAAYKELVSAYGAGRASSLRAMCWFLKWGAFTGNTLNGIVGNKKGRATSFLFQILFFIYYGPLFFGLINLVSALLKVSPRVPAWFSSFFGVVLAFIAGSFFIPLGLIGMVIAQPEKQK